MPKRVLIQKNVLYFSLKVLHNLKAFSLEMCPKNSLRYDTNDNTVG